MTTAAEAQVIALDDARPEIAESAWVAPGATVVGAVRLEDGASVWYSAVLRGDGDRIHVGAGSNVQDGCVLHADPGFPTSVGRGVSIGHRAVVHGSRIGDNVLVGMGAVVLNGCRIGENCLIAAGTVLLEGTEVPAGSLVVGTPGRVRRPLTEEEIGHLTVNAEHYRELTRRHAGAGA